MTSVSHWFDNLLRLMLTSVSRDRLIHRVEKIDREGREIRHDLKNIQQRSNALHALVSKMREDEVWRREKPE